MEKVELDTCQSYTGIGWKETDTRQGMANFDILSGKAFSQCGYWDS